MTPPVEQAPLLGRGAHRKRVDRLVVHSMAEYIRNENPRDGPVGTVPAHVWLGAIGLSAHALVKTDGTVLECVALAERAYHAQGHNDGTVGVELLVAGTHTYASFAWACGWDPKAWRPLELRNPDPYTAAQYDSLAWWLERAADGLGLGWDAVTSHDRIDPARKFDPGPLLDWQRLAAAFDRLRLERTGWPPADPEE